MQNFSTAALPVSIAYGSRKSKSRSSIQEFIFTILLILQPFYGPLSWSTQVSSTRRNIHSLTTILVINHPLWASSIYYDPQHLPYSIYVLDSLFAQPLSKSSLVYFLVWPHPLHIPYISSPNHCLLFAPHAHTIATCFAVVPKLCHRILVSLSTLYLELYLVA